MFNNYLVPCPRCGGRIDIYTRSDPPPAEGYADQKIVQVDHRDCECEHDDLHISVDPQDGTVMFGFTQYVFPSYISYTEQLP